jgi:RHS repeat-associated protein
VVLVVVNSAAERPVIHGLSIFHCVSEVPHMLLSTRSTLYATAMLLAGANTFGQSAHRQYIQHRLRPVTTTPHRLEGTLNLQTGRLTKTPYATIGNDGQDEVYDNTCLSGLYHGLEPAGSPGSGSYAAELVGDYGAIPSTEFNGGVGSGDSLCTVGCADDYDITQFEIAWCQVAGPVTGSIIELNFWNTPQDSCWYGTAPGNNPTGGIRPPATTTVFSATLQGLPRSNSIGTLSCYVLNIDLVTPGFSLSGSNSFTPGGPGDKFAWSFSIPTSTGADGPLIAGNINFGTPCTPCEGTIFEVGGQSTGRGTGAGQDGSFFWEDYGGTSISGGSGDCYSFGGANPPSGYYLELFATKPCVGGPVTQSFCDGTDGSLASCPCGPGASYSGCDSPIPAMQGGGTTGGISLSATEQTTSPNRATFTSVGYPAASSPVALLLCSNALDASSPVVFGDGVMCLDACGLVGLSATSAAGGSALHTVGHSGGAGTFYYQVYFSSSPTSFCNPADSFNLSNGQTLDWSSGGGETPFCLDIGCECSVSVSGPTQAQSGQVFDLTATVSKSGSSCSPGYYGTFQWPTPGGLVLLGTDDYPGQSRATYRAQGGPTTASGSVQYTEQGLTACSRGLSVTITAPPGGGNNSCLVGMSGPSAVSSGSVFVVTATATASGGGTPTGPGDFTWSDDPPNAVFVSVTTPQSGESRATFLASGAVGATASVSATYSEPGLECGSSHGITLADLVVPPIIEEPPYFCPSGTCPCDPTGLGNTCCSDGAGADTNSGDASQASNGFPANANRTGGNHIVLAHSGQEVLDAVDMTIKGRDSATGFLIKRRHVTRKDQANSIFGPAWAFNYAHTLTIDTSNTVLIGRFGRQDQFVPVGPDAWEGSRGPYQRLTLEPSSGLFTLRMEHGTVLTFASEGTGTSTQGHLTSVTSPNGNQILLEYETRAQQPVLQLRRMLKIVESYGREIDLFYENVAFPQVVTRIRDFSGREVLYSYSPTGQLEAVRSPTVTSTAGLNDFPGGKVTAYAYRNHSDPRLANALTEVVYPNENVAGGTTDSRLAWTYYESGEFFGYVHTHTVGNPDAPGNSAAGGDYAYEYETLGIPLGDPVTANTPAGRTTITDRRGTITTVELNFMGQILREEIRSNLELRPNEPAAYVRTFQFTEDGNLARKTDALGTSVEYLYPDPATTPRFSEGNVLDELRTADSRGADQLTLRTRRVYEPVFNKPFQVTNARGFEAGNTPEQFTTTFWLDYMEDLDAAKAHFAPQMGLTEPELQQLFDDAGLSDLGADVNGDGLTNQTCGTVIKVRYPDVQRPSQAALLGLGSTQTAGALFRYNQFGQRIYKEDAEENASEYLYYGADDPDGNGVVDVLGAASATGGYLRQIRRDFESLPGRQSNQNPPPVDQTVVFEYESQGAFPESLRGVPTAVIDPRGIEHNYLINELDQPVIEIRAADVSHTADPFLTAFAYERLTLYDANDNVVFRGVENKDTLDGDDDFITHAYSYDILDQVRSATLDVGGLDIVNRYSYDESQNLIEVVRGVGSSEEATDRFVYDERDLLVTATRGAGTLDESTTTTVVDANGNLAGEIDADGGHVTAHAYDGFDRMRSTTDRVGNRSVMQYDSASNVLSVQSFGPVGNVSLSSGPLMATGPIIDLGTRGIGAESTVVVGSGEGPAGGSPSLPLLTQTDYRYDERNRLFREDKHLFHTTNVGQLDDGLLDPGDGLVSNVWLLDRLGRRVGEIDADADLLETRFDGLSRVLRTVDAMNNEVSYTYDSNDNIVQITETERSPLINADEVFTTLRTYDALNRPQTYVEPNGQTSAYEYDSRDNLIRTTDELGNEVETRYDWVNRMTDSRTYLSATGESARAGNIDPTQGGGDGVVTFLMSWDDLHRLRSRTDDNGNVTTYTYDDLDRKTRCDYQDGTSETWLYNKDSELNVHTNQNGSAATWNHDAAGRPLRVTVDHGGATAPASGTLRKAWTYDGLDRVTSTYDDNGSHEDVRCLYLYDSLSRRIRESQMVGPGLLLTVDSEWEGAVRRTSRSYPDGRKVLRTYDALDRLFEIREGSDNSLIARFEYVGPERDALRTYGNGTVLDKRNVAGTQTTSGTDPGYDNNRRHVNHEWRSASSSLIAGYSNTYNGPSGVGTNRRITETRQHFGNETDHYTFDSAYRMLSFLRNADPLGVGGVLTTRSFDGADKMTSYVEKGLVDRMPVVDGDPPEAGINQYSSFDGSPRIYDANGSTTEEDISVSFFADGDFTYVYDFWDRLVEVRDTSDGQTVNRYAYAADNRRVVLDDRVHGVRDRFVYDGWQVAEERGSTDSLKRQYVDGRGLDEHIHVTLNSFPGDPEYFYHANSQGSVGATTDDTGDVVEYYAYLMLGDFLYLDPAGAPKSSSAILNNYLFQGRRYEPNTYLYYYRNRYYNLLAGEFMTQDPLGNWSHDQGNGYSAFGEDCWNSSDPMGLSDDGVGYGNFVGPRCRQCMDPIGPIDRAAKEHDEAIGRAGYGVWGSINPFWSSDTWDADLRLCAKTLISNPLEVGSGGDAVDRVVGNVVVRPLVVAYEGSNAAVKLVAEVAKRLLGKGWLW